jgi:hypothetical protein
VDARREPRSLRAAHLIEWVQVAWHIKGAAGTFEQWLDLPEFDREVIVREVHRRISMHNAAFDDV